ncbi:MAG: electron transfer flavoprotein subunit alpha/FixB family protein [Myxococcota bacterium]
MSNVLVFVEQQGGTPKKQALASVAFGQQAAKATGGELHLLVAGADAAKAGEAVKGYGAAKVHVVEDAALTNYLAESYTAVVEQAVKAIGATLVAGGATSTTKDFFPRVAVRLDAAMASDVMSVESATTFTRAMWAGAAIATVELTTDTKVVTVRATEFDAPEAGGEAPVEALAVSLPATKAEFVNLQAIESERPDATVADVVVSGGRGIKGPEGFKLIEDLADLLGGGVGASRAICDAGWVPNDLQVGQTGKVVAPNLYIAAGLSGAIQHLAGMKGSKVIVAINKDPEAPIFQVADYGIVSDLFEVIPELMSSIKS